jgi:hypothetical protein
VSALQDQITALQATVTALQNTVTSNNNVAQHPIYALDPFVSVNGNPVDGVVGPNIYITGANVHIVSGSGSTSDGSHRRGLGNLIIGYNEVK